MNRKVLAFMIPALLAIGAAHAVEVYGKDGSKLDLYGKVDDLHYLSGDASNDGDQTYFHGGFKGETQINDMLTGYGQWEYQANADTTESNRSDNSTRLAFADLEFDNYGSFDYGRNYGIMCDIEGWTDMLPEFGGNSYTKADNSVTGRTNGVAACCNTDFLGMANGLNFVLQYQGTNEQKSDGYGQGGTGNGGSASDSSRNVQNSNGDGFGPSSAYGLGMGTSFDTTYTMSDRTNEQTTKGGDVVGGDKADSWAVDMKYDTNSTHLTTVYAEARSMVPYGDSGVVNKTQNFEITAWYQFDFGLHPSASFLMSRGQDLGASGSDGDKDLVKYADIGATYYLNKNMSTYADYKINLLDGDDSFYISKNVSTGGIVTVGLTYQLQARQPIGNGGLSLFSV